MPSPDEIALLQKLTQTEEKYALSQQRDANRAAMTTAQQISHDKEVSDLQAVIKDLKAALAIAQGEHGKTWGGGRHSIGGDAWMSRPK